MAVQVHVGRPWGRYLATVLGQPRAQGRPHTHRQAHRRRPLAGSVLCSLFAPRKPPARREGNIRLIAGLLCAMRLGGPPGKARRLMMCIPSQSLTRGRQDGVSSIKRCVQNNFADVHRQQVCRLCSPRLCSPHGSVRPTHTGSVRPTHTGFLAWHRARTSSHTVRAIGM